VAALEAKRTALCDDMLKRLDVFVLPYGSNTKLTRSEVQRADAFFLGIVRERKGTKLLARALDVLSLKHAVRVLLFYVRNLLPLATEADAADERRDRSSTPASPAVFRHLVGIIGACERQQVVIAMQTLISFHASQRDVRARAGARGRRRGGDGAAESRAPARAQRRRRGPAGEPLARNFQVLCDARARRARPHGARGRLTATKPAPTVPRIQTTSTRARRICASTRSRRCASGR
jgi:hypothetical protein